MESPPKPCASRNPLLSLSAFLHQHCLRLGSELSSRLDETKRLAVTLAASFPPPPPPPPSPPPAPRRLLRALPAPPPPFASVAQAKAASSPASGVARTLAGTAVYTVSNSNNEFVLVSDPDGTKSIGLLCFRQEDAESFLAQVRLRRRELKGQARVVPITLDQVYMLKVEGIAFRFLPDPVQIKNALEMKAMKNGFDGVPVFQSDLLVVKKKNRRFCPIYFRKEDIEKELSMVSRASRGAGLSQHIMVGSLEDVLRKMEMSEKNSGWEDLIFIPPGKSHSQHIQEVVKS
ncbi:protein TIC 22, chloroplastic isoform X1 [Syzygium oleosum]|uniref:protein TIC 22, chloroplastic isoform X1 n=1 Tax=Syzygium oleosum TaxID=219896 RepID=UPI0024BB51AE|nr:protein TIC 22, chloroplastic isoform X1 [Syzygium oleosum]XP_056167957.1 protein TIC 22, chloroplastic isoform X1 [Syzygium oleosum]